MWVVILKRLRTTDLDTNVEFSDATVLETTHRCSDIACTRRRLWLIDL